MDIVKRDGGPRNLFRELVQCVHAENALQQNASARFPTIHELAYSDQSPRSRLRSIADGRGKLLRFPQYTFSVARRDRVHELCFDGFGWREAVALQRDLTESNMVGHLGSEDVTE